MTTDAPPPIPPSPPMGPPPGPPAGPDPIPFEQEGVPFATGFLDTIKLVITHPVQAFQRVPANSEIVRPLLYAIVIGTLSAFVGWVWQTTLGDPTSRLFPRAESDMNAMELELMKYSGSILIVFVAPVLIAVFLFLWAAVIHLLLMLLGGANAGFLATFKVLCYGETTSLASVVPICGGFGLLVWKVVLAIIGVAQVHRTSGGKATLAVLLPIVLCCVCFIVAVVIFGAALATALGQG